jgi:hypothetical protein|tara:strand:- start:1194 stop:1565 length:372 start_codon:yes stop_codon:yes gene_type:complete
MITYNWNCRTVDAYVEQNNETDVVYNIHWIVSGISDTLNPQGDAYSATNIGTQVINTSDITDFVPFDQITNEEVVAWTQLAMGEEQVASIEAGIASQIEKLIKPTTVTLTIKETSDPLVNEEE